DRLVDAGFFELAQVLPQLLRRADAAGAPAEKLRAQLVAHHLVHLPDVGAAWLVAAEVVVVPQRELEEAEAIVPAPEGLFCVRVAGEARDHGNVRVHGMADGHALTPESL